MSQEKTGRGSDQFMLRMPDGMRDRIKKAAADNNRSMNAEIVSTLEEQYPESDFDALALAPFLEVIKSASSDEIDGIMKTLQSFLKASGSNIWPTYDEEEGIILHRY